MQQGRLRRTANARPLELAADPKETFETPDPSDEKPPEYRWENEMEPYVVIRSSIQRSGAEYPLAVSGLVAERDFSDAILDIPRPVVVVDGAGVAAERHVLSPNRTTTLVRATTAQEANERLREKVSDAVGRAITRSTHSATIGGGGGGAGGGVGPSVLGGDRLGASAGVFGALEGDARVIRLVRLLREAAALEELVATFKMKDDEAEAEKARKEEEAARERERIKKERMLDAWLYTESSDEEGEKEEPQQPPAKPPRKIVTNTQILAGVRDLQLELQKIADTVRESASVRPLIVDPREFTEKSTPLGPDLLAHMDSVGLRLHRKLESIAVTVEHENTIYTESQYPGGTPSPFMFPHTASYLRRGSRAVPQQQLEQQQQLQQAYYDPSLHPHVAFVGQMEAPPKHLLGPAASSGDGNHVVHYQLLQPPESDDIARLTKLYTLENRLTGLERRIGMHHLKMHDTSAQTGGSSINAVLQASDSVLGALDKLDHQLAVVMDPAVMDSTVKEVTNVAADMRKLLEVRRMHAEQLSDSYSGGNSLAASLQQQQQKLKAAAVAAAAAALDDPLTNTVATPVDEDTPASPAARAAAAQRLGKRSSTLTEEGDPSDSPSIRGFIPPPRDTETASPTATASPGGPLKLRGGGLRASANLTDAAVAQTALTDLQKQTRETATEKRVQALYGKMHTHDTLVSQLPYLVLRLQSLRVLHARADGLSERLNRVMAEQMKTMDSLRGVEGLVRVVEEGIRANAGAVEDNFEALEGRVKGLMLRATGERRSANAYGSAIEVQNIQVDGEEWVNVSASDRGVPQRRRTIGSRDPSPVRSEDESIMPDGYTVNL
ncbi:hypothetical protein BC830DRAFT_1132520 [Chytriomyces sp. MP71]|nr:hypothetical protein BC830DRAFT_1132520 [Chytriomyces sp. MP71]